MKTQSNWQVHAAVLLLAILGLVILLPGSLLRVA
jgi:hypothetical protein